MKNTKITSLFIFLSGTAVGALATWKYAEEKYKQIAKEEIESVKRTFSKKEPVFKSDDEKSDTMSVSEYARKVEQLGYASNKSAKERKIDEPYVIAPEDLGNYADYEQIELHYYNDGVLTDELDEIVDDPEEIVGKEIADHFGEYEEDTVCIRNDALKTDYEILRVPERYSDSHDPEGVD